MPRPYARSPPPTAAGAEDPISGPPPHQAAGLAALAGFAVRERRLGQRGGRPLIDPGLFRSVTFTCGAVLGGVAGLAMIGLLFAIPQYFQAVQGASAFGSGLRLLPLIGGLIAGSLAASALARTAGPSLP